VPAILRRPARCVKSTRSAKAIWTGIRKAPKWKNYCPNAPELDSLTKLKGRSPVYAIGFRGAPSTLEYGHSIKNINRLLKEMHLPLARTWRY
jgi:hypothetical protein